MQGDCWSEVQPTRSPLEFAAVLPSCSGSFELRGIVLGEKVNRLSTHSPWRADTNRLSKPQVSVGDLS